MKRNIEQLVSILTQDQLEHFNERAAIMEYDGKIQRDKAEHLAMLDTIKVYNITHNHAAK